MSFCCATTLGRPGRMMAATLWALAICASISACTPSDRPRVGPPEKITFAYATAPLTALADIAFAKGYFRHEGLEVKPTFHLSGKDALKEVMEGRADFATVADIPVMFAIMQGQKISIIATIQISSNSITIIARKDRGILSQGDLKGKRIAAPMGTTAQFYLDTVLSARGISSGEVAVENMSPDKTADALAKGDISAASMWPPYLNEAQEKLGGGGITFHDEDLYLQYFNVVATKEYVRGHPLTIRKILSALIRAERFVARHPDETLQTISRFRKMDRVFLADMWTGSTYSVTLDQMLLVALEDESSWAIKGGLTDKTKVPDYLDYLYLDGLRSVNPKAVRVIDYSTVKPRP